MSDAGTGEGDFAGMFGNIAADDYGGAEFGGTGDSDPGFSGGQAGDVGPDSGGAVGGGPGDVPFPPVAPVAPVAPPPVAEPAKKKPVARKARRRSILTGEGDDEPIYRRSILGGS